jgi:hypothetical protein
VPTGLKVTAQVREHNYHELKLTHPLWPYQKPVPKLAEAQNEPAFLVDTAACSGAKAAQFQKAWNGELQVRQYRKRTRDFVDILVRPFAYHAAEGRVRYPAELVLDLCYEAPGLPKAAGPRLGNPLGVEAILRRKADLDWLTREGFNFERRGLDRVEVFATPTEIEALKAAGFELPEVSPKSFSPEDQPGDVLHLGAYHDYDSLTRFLHQWTNSHPDVCRLVSIGRSVQNRELWAMRLTVQSDLDVGKPRVRLAGTIHGDEPVGAEICLYLIDLLASGSKTNHRIANLLAATEIWVLPLLNPDGHALGSRFNASGHDLNRCFPDGGGSGLGNPLFGPPLPLAGRPPEIANLMRFSTNYNFSLAVNLHAGSLVVNYPYDDDDLGTEDSPTPDDALFKFIAREYSSHNLPMWNSSSFPQGIVNGAQWYVINGGLQDWNYRYLGCNELTIELSDNKHPPASQLPQLWDCNRDAMLSLIETVHTGLKGKVSDLATAQPVYAAVKALGIEHGVFSDPNKGDYHRMLRPGAYHLLFTAPNYATRIYSNVLIQAGQAVRLDIALERLTKPQERLLLVSSESLSLGLPPLQARKEADGFAVQRLVVADGAATNRISSAIRDACSIFPADYILLVGDTPQLPAFSDGHATDLPYGLLDAGETLAEYLGTDAVLGRLSVTAPDSVVAFVQKLNAFAYNLSNRIGNLTWISHGHNPSEYARA